LEKLKTWFKEQILSMFSFWTNTEPTE
jgi:hypothetical protein